MIDKYNIIPWFKKNHADVTEFDVEQSIARAFKEIDDAPPTSAYQLKKAAKCFICIKTMYLFDTEKMNTNMKCLVNKLSDNHFGVKAIEPYVEELMKGKI